MPPSSEKIIPTRFEEDMQALCRAMSCTEKEVAGILSVIEFKVEIPRRGAFYIQIIVNPWSHTSHPPRVHILGVDWIEGPEPLNLVEGRYLLDLPIGWDWEDDPSLVRFWDESLSPVLDDLFGQVRFRIPPKSPGAYGLFFPTGAINEVEQIKSFAKSKGWKLLGKAESKIHAERSRIIAEAEESAMKAKIQSLELGIEMADDESSLEEIRTRIEEDESIAVEADSLLERIKSRLREFETKRIDFDSLAKTKAQSHGHAKKEYRNRVRRL